MHEQSADWRGEVSVVPRNLQFAFELFSDCVLRLWNVGNEKNKSHFTGSERATKWIKKNTSCHKCRNTCETPKWDASMSIAHVQCLFRFLTKDADSLDVEWLFQISFCLVRWSSCLMPCVYSIRNPFSSRKFLFPLKIKKWTGNGHRMHNSVDVVDRIYALSLCGITIYNFSVPGAIYLEAKQANDMICRRPFPIAVQINIYK